jgi:hypothetical protein
MSIYTGLANIKNPGKGVQWASVVVLICFQLLNGLSAIWLGECHLFLPSRASQRLIKRPTAFLYAVEILPLQYRSQVQAGSNTVFWFLVFVAVYFGGQGAADPKVGAKVFITFCITGAIITVLTWIYVVESKFLHDFHGVAIRC